MEFEELKKAIRDPKVTDYDVWRKVHAYAVAQERSYAADEFIGLLFALSVHRPGLDPLTVATLNGHTTGDEPVITIERFASCVKYKATSDEFLVAIFVNVEPKEAYTFRLMFGVLDHFRPHVSDAFKGAVMDFIAQKAQQEAACPHATN